MAPHTRGDAASESVTAYPLSWPLGWPRTLEASRRRWRGGSRPPTTGRARDELLEELRRLGAREVVLSTDLRLRNDGLPRADAREPLDPGVAVYFRLQGQPRVLACDRWKPLAGNLRALTMHVYALRGIDRWGVGTIAQAFAGYTALPGAGEGTVSWAEVLRIDPSAPTDQVQVKLQRALVAAHPDQGGSQEQLERVLEARRAFREERGLA